MKKLLLGLAVILAGCEAARANVFRDAQEQTGAYAFQTLTVAYYDHFHHEARDKNFYLSAPLAAYWGIGLDPFATFDGSKVQEFGLKFNIFGHMKRVHLEPFIFRNNDADAVGLGCSAVIRLR